MVANIFAVLILCQLTVATIGSGDQGNAVEICEQISSLYMKQCSRRVSVSLTGETPSRGFPGKRGVRGSIGPVGPVGPPGPQGIVDYEKINRERAAKQLELEAKLNEKFVQLEQKLNATITQLIDENTRLKNPIHNCELRYNGKCYRAILQDRSDVNFAAAVTVCDNIGWKLANIYSKEHYDILADYLRTKVAPVNYATAWLGMTYDSTTKRMYLVDGTLHTIKLPWYPSYPRTESSLSKTSIYISRSSASIHHGIINYSATLRRRGALCEA